MFRLYKMLHTHIIAYDMDNNTEANLPNPWDQTDHWFSFVIWDVLILYGTFSDGMFSDGTFSDGMFSDGTFSDGMFSDGTFSDGTFCITTFSFSHLFFPIDKS